MAVQSCTGGEEELPRREGSRASAGRRGGGVRMEPRLVNRKVIRETFFRVHKVTGIDEKIYWKPFYTGNRSIGKAQGKLAHGIGG